MKFNHLRFFTLIFWVLLSAFANPVYAAIPTDAELKRQIDQMLDQPAEKLDLAQSLILVSQHWNPTLDTGPLKQQLNALTEKARTRLQGETSPQKIVKALTALIHNEEGFLYTDQVDAQGMPVVPAELFVHGLLESKRGYCMTLSLLYLILAERLDLPLYGVALPNHFFVRYESGETRINIEATEKGIEQPDSFYQSRFGVSEDAKYFMKSLDHKKSLGAYLANVGITYYRSQKAKEAIWYLDHSARVNPDAIDVHNNLANIYSDRKEFDKAEQHYLRALETEPSNPATLFNLGITYTDWGKIDQAIETFLRVAAVDSSFQTVHEVLARLYLQKEEYIGALLHLKLMDRLKPQQFPIRMQMGEVLLAMKEYALALRTFQWVQESFPLKLEVNDRLGEVYYMMKDYDKALVQYEYLIDKIPTVMSNYVQMGWIYYRKKDLDQAIAWTQRGLQSAREFSRYTTLAHMNLGLYHALQRKTKEAREWYKKALQAQAGNAAEGMVADLKEGIDAYSDIPELHFFAGWILFHSKQPGAARPWLEKFLELSPNSTLASEALVMLEKAARSAPPGMVPIPKGMFIMGSNDHGDDEAPEHEVYLDDYFIDPQEVTASEFAQFLNSIQDFKKFYRDTKYGTLVHDMDKGWLARPGFESHPANNVSWYGAEAFCKWKHKRLPTEAEWEKAARGTKGFVFPWGNDPISPQRSRYKLQWTEEIAHNVMVPVNSMPEGASPYGLLHMLGNVKEWVDDWYDREYYKEEAHKMNPPGQIGGEFKVLKGGSWRDLRIFVYASFRNNSYPQTAMDDYGFRCAWSEPKIQAPKKLINFDGELGFSTSPITR